MLYLITDKLDVKINQKRKGRHFILIKKTLDRKTLPS